MTGRFRIRYMKVACKACSWPLAREYTGNELRIEIKISAAIISLSSWPEFIICARCGAINTTEDLKANRSDGATEETASEQARS